MVVSAPARPGASLRRRPSGLSRQQDRVGWIFSAPFVTVFLVFTAIPILISLIISFTDMRAVDLRNPLSVEFIGLRNYESIFSDQQFLRSILNTILYVVVGVPMTMAIGLTLAIVLNTGVRRFRRFYRVAFYAPVVTNVVAVAMIWQYAFNVRGPINSALAVVGIQGPNWLGDVTFAMPVVILLGVWCNFGNAMVLYLAGLQAVPEEIYEASALDGAGFWRNLWSMTLPLLRPTTLLISVLMTIFSLQIFDVPYLLTNGGPLGSTRTIALYTYEQFGFGNYARASAASYVMVLLVSAVSLVQFRLLRSKTQ